MCLASGDSISRSSQAELLHKGVVKAAGHLRGFLADEVESLIQRGHDLVGNENSGLQGFLDSGILRGFAEFFKDLRRALRTLPKVAQHEYE